MYQLRLSNKRIYKLIIAMPYTACARSFTLFLGTGVSNGFEIWNTLSPS